MKIFNHNMGTSMTNSTIVLSVCVAVFNVSDYLAECLESLHAQTLASVEFIIVDDGSTDECLEIARRYESQDDRFRVIAHSSNKGTLVARKTAIQAANGRYAMFVDGDDRLSCPEALSIALSLIEREKVDILHFTSEVFGAPLSGHECILAWLNQGTKGKVLSRTQYLDEIFLKGARGWTIWNKIYRTAVLKKAVFHIREERCISAEDAYLTFLFGYFSSRFLSCNTSSIYSYRVGCGISTSTVVLEKFVQHYVQETCCCNWLEEFARSQDNWTTYVHHVHALRRTLIRGCCKRMASLPEKDWAQAFDTLADQNNPSDVVEGLSAVFGASESFGPLVSRLTHAKRLVAPGRANVRTVAVIYNRYYEGGVQRVMSLQIPLIISLGYRVVLMTDEIDTAREYPLPTQVDRVVLPRTYKANRAAALATALREKNIDCVFYHQTSSWDCCVWDLMLMRLSGVHVIALLHELPFSLLSVSPRSSVYAFESARPSIYHLASRLIVLDRSQESYFKCMGVNATYVPNPLTYDLSDCRTAPRARDRAGVYWVGRLDERQKNVSHVLEIFKGLVERAPSVQCFLVGPEYDEGQGQRVLSFIRDNSLQDNVHWLGARNDVDKCLRKARVLLVTSRFESFMLVLAEAKCCGTPVVMYELPYLELARSGRGLTTVPQGSVDDAVDEVLDILRNDARCDQMISDALLDIQDFYARYDLKSIWKRIIEAPAASDGVGVSIELLTAQFEQQERFMCLALRALEKGVDDRCKTKRVPFLKALKYLVLSRIAYTRDRRRQYQQKLQHLLASK